MGLEIFAGRGGCGSVLGHAGAPAGRSSRPAGSAVRVAGRTRCPKGGPPPSSSPSTFLISASSGPGSGSGRRRLGYTGRQPVSGSDQPRPAVRRGPGGLGAWERETSRSASPSHPTRPSLLATPEAPPDRRGIGAAAVLTGSRHTARRHTWIGVTAARRVAGPARTSLLGRPATRKFTTLTAAVRSRRRSWRSRA